MHLTAYLREIKSPAHPRHCRDSSEVKSWHFSPAVSPLSPALGVSGLQMTGQLAVTKRCAPSTGNLHLGGLF